MTTTGAYNLPQMKSIWLDEDEEAEKLYGLQVQQFMGQDDDENLAIMMVNSDKPLLSNKKNIDLPPLVKSTKTSKFFPSSQISQTKKKLKKKKGLFAFFKGKEQYPAQKTQQISTPYGFQHISHADVRTGFESEDTQNEDVGGEAEEKIMPTARPLSKAFVTHSIPARVTSSSGTVYERKRASSSARMSIQASISTASSRNSRFSNAGRIVSSSTMATSVLNESSSPSRFAPLSQMEKVSSRNKKNRQSDSSEASINFLKNYDFPTLLENKPTVNETNTPTKIVTIVESDSDDNGKHPQSPSLLSRVKSDPQLLHTPEMESRWFSDETPASRKSLDDVLLCYHQSSDLGSPLQTTPLKSSTSTRRDKDEPSSD